MKRQHLYCTFIQSALQWSAASKINSCKLETRRLILSLTAWNQEPFVWQPLRILSNKSTSAVVNHIPCGIGKLDRCSRSDIDRMKQMVSYKEKKTKNDQISLHKVKIAIGHIAKGGYTAHRRLFSHILQCVFSQYIWPAGFAAAQPKSKKANRHLTDKEQHSAKTPHVRNLKENSREQLVSTHSDQTAVELQHPVGESGGRPGFCLSRSVNPLLKQAHRSSQQPAVMPSLLESHVVRSLGWWRLMTNQSQTDNGTFGRRTDRHGQACCEPPMTQVQLRKEKKKKKRLYFVFIKTRSFFNQLST